MNNDFTHLHIHSQASLLDGLPTAEELVARAKELGHESVALTDHGSMANALQFYMAAKEAGIKPIIGMEGYLADDLTARNKDDVIYHIGLLAKNYVGYQNLCRLSDIGWNKGFYRKPRIDFNTLTDNAEGLIILSGCMDGPICHPLRNGEMWRAVRNNDWLMNAFPDNYFIEIQPWNPDGLNKELLEIAESRDIPVVATADAHTCTQEDMLTEEVALLINQNTDMKVKDKDEVKRLFQESREEHHSPMARINFLYPHRKLRFDKIGNYMMSKKNLELRMLDAGYDVPESYSNTLLVADMVEEYEIPLNQNYLPKFMRRGDSYEYLEELAFDKLYDKGLEDIEEYTDRLKEELSVIKSLGFEDYMLVIWDMCNWAHSQGIMTGPGRGSVAGSLLAYVLGITRVDPIKHGLLFWRFLNVDESGKSARIDPPDIDTDIEDNRRDEVKQYLIDRWKYVASISAVNKFSSKGMIRDLSRVFAIPLDEVNKVAKHFSNLEEYFASEKTQEFRTKYPEIGEIARKLEGRWRSQGMHAAGMVVANQPLENILPLESRAPGVKGDVRIRATAFDMDDVQRLGLLKLDALGVKALTVVDDALQLIKERHEIDVDLDDLDLDDPDVLMEFTLGHTAGIFQVDTQTYSRLLKDMRVDSFNDLMASNSLIRPGPLLSVTPQYISRKHGAERPQEHPLMAKFTDDTYGLIIYQEQLMLALVDIGGFTRTEADKVRKIIGKKRDPEEFKPFEQKWIENAGELLGKTRATKLWRDFLKFAGYAFNKAHSCAYSILSYQTMWLKKYYPTEYITALLKNENDTDKITTFIFEAKRLGIKIAMPDINYSEKSFSIFGNRTIMYGLSNIHGVGAAASDEIILDRPYASLADFKEKVPRKKCNVRVIDNLINVGAFKDLPDGPDVKYEDYYYSMLGYAQDLSEQHLDVEINTTSLESLGNDYGIIIALVKNIVRKPEWIRIEVEDSSGAGAFFARSDYVVEAGKVVVALVRGSDWLGYTYLDDLNEKAKNNTPLDKFEEYLTGKVFGEEKKLYNYGIGKFDSDKVLVLPLSIRRFKINKGRLKDKSMASIVVTDGETIMKIPVFPQSYANCAGWLKEYEPIVIKTVKMKNGETTVSDDGVRLAKKLLEEKEYGERKIFRE